MKGIFDWFWVLAHLAERRNGIKLS